MTHDVSAETADRIAAWIEDGADGIVWGGIASSARLAAAIRREVYVAAPVADVPSSSSRSSARRALSWVSSHTPNPGDAATGLLVAVAFDVLADSGAPDRLRYPALLVAAAFFAWVKGARR